MDGSSDTLGMDANPGGPERVAGLQAGDDEGLLLQTVEEKFRRRWCSSVMEHWLYYRVLRSKSMVCT